MNVRSPVVALLEIGGSVMNDSVKFYVAFILVNLLDIFFLEARILWNTRKQKYFSC